jgi:hypothetical protein
VSELNFHVRHEVTPERSWDVLTAIVEGFSHEHIVQADRQIGRLRQLGLLQKEKDKTVVSPLGDELYRIGTRKQEVAMDVFHYLHYSLWNESHRLENTLSWSYRAHCDDLFTIRECALDKAGLEHLTAELNNKIIEYFGADVAKTKKGSIALSTNSIKGIHHWLATLNPLVLENDGERFVCRSSCSPEMLLLGLGYMAQSTGSELGIDLLLTPENREVACRVCLLNPENLDRELDWMLSLYPSIVQPGTLTGGYGRFIRFLKLPTLNDLLQ